MLHSTREANDRFVFLASPLASGSYGLMIYPASAEIPAEVEVTKGRLRGFLFRHRKEIEVELISGSEDLFVSSLTEEEVLELTVQDACLRRCASRFEVRQ